MMSAIVDRIWSIIGRPLNRRQQIKVRSLAHLFHNISVAALHPRSYLSSREEIRGIENSLESKNLHSGADGRIPKLIHFVYGFKRDEYFPLYALIAIQSAAFHHPGWRIVFHYMYEPRGEYWTQAKQLVILNRLPNFDLFGVARVFHYAHKADIVRLLALKTMGGAYLDIDTITVRSFEDLRDHEFVMAVQAEHNGAKGGLCNAAMLGSPNSRFATRWLRHYSYFHSRGRDYLWDFHSVKLPAMLYSERPDEVHVLNSTSFFYPLWTDVDRILFAEDSIKWLKYLNESYLFHLWNNFTRTSLDSIDATYIAKSQSLYAHHARIVLKGIVKC